MIFKPDTFYRMTRRGSGSMEYFYCSPKRDMLPLSRLLGYPFTAYWPTYSTCFDNSKYIIEEECERMQICWVYNIQLDDVLILVYSPSELPKIERYYREQSASFILLHTLSDFHSVLTTRKLKRLAIPRIGCITDEGMFFYGYNPMYKLIDRDFFADKEICRLYGITETDVIDYFLFGDFQSWEKLPWDNCYYKYGSYMFYISSRKEVTDRFKLCWFKWKEEYNCYVQVSCPGGVMSAKTQPLVEEPTIGCVDNGFRYGIELALREGKLGDGVCSLGEALTRVMDSSTESEILVGDWEFTLDRENKVIHYNRRLKVFEEGVTKWSLSDIVDKITLE